MRGAGPGHHRHEVEHHDGHPETDDHVAIGVVGVELGMQGAGREMEQVEDDEGEQHDAADPRLPRTMSLTGAQPGVVGRRGAILPGGVTRPQCTCRSTRDQQHEPDRPQIAAFLEERA
jgi:hypothetical protein